MRFCNKVEVFSFGGGGKKLREKLSKFSRNRSLTFNNHTDRRESIYIRAPVSPRLVNEPVVFEILFSSLHKRGL